MGTGRIKKTITINGAIRLVEDIDEDSGEPFGPAVWWAVVDAVDLAQIFGARSTEWSGPNVIVVDEKPRFARPLDEEELEDLGLDESLLTRAGWALNRNSAELAKSVGSLSFDPSSARLIHASRESWALIVRGGDGDRGSIDGSAILRQGDERFLSELPSELSSLGRNLIESVRRKHPGDLRLFPGVGRYVETPDNFWTVKPQPRVRSLAITVRGLPTSFGGDGDFDVTPSGKEATVTPRGQEGRLLVLKKDRGSYSRFVVTSGDELFTALRVIDWASSNRR